MSRARRVAARRLVAPLACGLLALGACGDGDGDGDGDGGDDDGSPSASSTSSSTAADTTETSDLATVTAVLASRLRGEFPGIHDTKLAIEGGEMRLEFDIGTGDVPADALAFAKLAAGELQIFAPEVLTGISDVTVQIVEGDGPVEEETFSLHDDLLHGG